MLYVVVLRRFVLTLPGAALPVWRRVTEAEELLAGQRPSGALLAAAGAEVVKGEIDDVAALLHAHPTQSEALGEAHLALAGKPLHVHG